MIPILTDGNIASPVDYHWYKCQFLTFWKSSSVPEPDSIPGPGAPLPARAAQAAETTRAASELGDDQDKSSQEL